MDQNKRQTPTQVDRDTQTKRLGKLWFLLSERITKDINHLRAERECGSFSVVILGQKES